MRKIASAAMRARWLAEVAQALDQAHSLVELINGKPGDWRERAELAHRIAAARQLTRTLRASSERRLEREVPPE
jgi:uncharacterized membrane protein YfbV (UPF0208 family)